ncbi:tetratricopeptide repeat protein [Corynebacterium sp. YIM 101645]|uniref:Tetratricopeptide repeat protein n=1 Tax=Corynebacterium lemuris TaxID=1859292 RepID=A0ABT2FUU4_9CORY|nr:tetratricopeptide repeat protein [Corynebacterium lemuris]MCS5479009.1 tetratricopeptide repeat protein [Corynebacterium lemuris]
MNTPHRYVSGAIDLGEVKARAEARDQAAQQVATGTGPAPYLTVTPQNFENDVVRRSLEVPVVVLVGTPRSPESEQLRADLQQLAEGAGLSYIVGYVDADATPEVAQAFGVQVLPTVIALGGGRPVTQFEGGQPADALRTWLDALVTQVGPQLSGLQAAPAEEDAPEDPRLGQALAALNAGDFDVAIAVYDEILAETPGDQDIVQARDTAKLLQRLDPASRTEDPVAAADADPTDVEKQFTAADAEVVAGAPERAFDRLLALMVAVPGEKLRVRDRLVELFALFDAADPRVTGARTRMASVLF